MDCGKARRILQNILDNRTKPDEHQEARAHLATCQACQAALSDLWAEIKRDEQVCTAVEEMLPVYVEDEIAGRAVQELYPQLWQHLAECPFCAQAHAQLQAWMQAEGEERWIEPASYPALNLPFLTQAAPAEQAPAWEIESWVEDALGHFSAVITISKAYIAGTLSPQQFTWARSGESPSQRPTHFPLLDSLREDSAWLVSIEVLHTPGAPPAPEQWHFQVWLSNPKLIEGQIEVHITDGQEERTTIANEQGEALFRNVPPTWLEPAGKLKVQIRQV